MIYLTPSLLHRLKKNPFANETRDTPVEFGYRRSYSEEVRLKLPDGYRIIEAPPLARRRSKDIQFTSLCARDEEGLKFQRRLVLNKPVFQPDEYKSLQVAYRMIVGADRKQIILARRTEADVEGNSE